MSEQVSSVHTLIEELLQAQKRYSERTQAATAELGNSNRIEVVAPGTELAQPIGNFRPGQKALYIQGEGIQVAVLHPQVGIGAVSRHAIDLFDLEVLTESLATESLVAGASTDTSILLRELTSEDLTTLVLAQSIKKAEELFLGLTGNFPENTGLFLAGVPFLPGDEIQRLERVARVVSGLDIENQMGQKGMGIIFGPPDHYFRGAGFTDLAGNDVPVYQ